MPPVVLKEENLEEFLEELRAQWPQSLSIYMLARNHFLKNEFAWPGIEFVVDRFPSHTASLVRPVKGVQKFAPRHSPYHHALHAVSPEALRNFLEESDVIDWSRPNFFAPVSRPLADVLFEICGKHGTYVGHKEREDFQAFVVVFRPEKLIPGPVLPEGFTLKSLERSHMETVNSIWIFGGTEMTLEYMLHLYDHGFPTFGIFAPDGELAAYVMTASDMAMIAAYVMPKYRNQKLFHILTYRWCEKAFELGIELPFAFVSEQNIRSQKSLFRVGAERADWEFVWTLFVPHGYDNPQNLLLKWYSQLGVIIWKQ